MNNITNIKSIWLDDIERITRLIDQTQDDKAKETLNLLLEKICKAGELPSMVVAQDDSEYVTGIKNLDKLYEELTNK